MIGFTIRPIKRRVSLETAKQFLDVPVANLSDCMSRMTAGGPRLRPYHGSGAMAGPAFTVKTRPGDNLLVHKALDMALPGDVLVVDAGGDLTNSIIGEIMATYARMRGIAGVVINGAIRDSGPIGKQNWPVFAAGVTHRGPLRSGPGELGRAIAIDGMVIEPGDLIVGDDDGIVCVPYDDVEEVLRLAKSKRDEEHKILDDILNGRPTDRAWIDATLAKLGATSSDE
jgi:regulator of RNase E activity RraA